jgi:hypothetical protein
VNVTARTSLLLKIALVVLILISAREIAGVRNTQVSSTGARETNSRQLLSAVAMTTTPGRDDDVHDAVDLYGNEVTPAVATYKLDGTGALYELHSPQTELPQLAPPKS